MVRTWTPRRWATAVVGAAVIGVFVALPTAVIPNPLFGRSVAVTWWSYPTVVVSAALGGLLVATYVRDSGTTSEPDRGTKAGLAGGLVSFFAVGCPVCNKIVLLALGASGAVSWFAPIQPVLAVASVALMTYALHTRLNGEIACDVDLRPPSSP